MKIILPIIMAVLLLTGCKKDKGPDRTALLTAGPWRLIGMTLFNKNTGETRDEYATSKACSRDNEFVFNTNYSHEFTEGATKCNSADPQVIYYAKWKFINNETVIEVSAGSERIEMKVLELTASDLIIESENANTIQKVSFIHR